MGKPEGKKLTKEELDEIRKSFCNGFGIHDEAMQLLFHITALEGEQKEWWASEALLKEKDGEIERLEIKKAKDWAYHLSDLNKKQATIENMREAAKPFNKLLDAHDKLAAEVVEVCLDDCMLGYTDGVQCTPKDLRNLKQACTEGENVECPDCTNFDRVDCKTCNGTGEVEG